MTTKKLRRRTRKPITESLKRARGLRLDRKTRRLYEEVNSTIENQDRYNELVDNLSDTYNEDEINAILNAAQADGRDPLGEDFDTFMDRDFDFFPDVKSDEELGERYAEEVLDIDRMFDVIKKEFGDTIAYWTKIDYEGLGRDIRIGDAGQFTKYGYFSMRGQ